MRGKAAVPLLKIDKNARARCAPLPSLSFAGGVEASYEVAAGQTSVTISSDSRLNPRGIYAGTGQMVFHWVQHDKSESWECEISMADQVPVQAQDVSTGDGTQKIKVNLGNVFPAGLILQGRMVGTLVAPAVHLDVAWGSDVWVFLVRSPWFPLRLQLAKPALVVQHGTSRATAELGVSGANVSAQVAVNGADYKEASLTLVRTLGSYTSKEAVGEMAGGLGGAQSFGWKPIWRSFDLVLVTKGSISESQLGDLVKGLGAETTWGLFGPGGVQGDFILCDGPALTYGGSSRATGACLPTTKTLPLPSSRGESY